VRRVLTTAINMRITWCHMPEDRKLHLIFWLTRWLSDYQERLCWKEHVICSFRLFIYRPFQGRDTNVGNTRGVTWDALIIVLICSFVVWQLELGCWEELQSYAVKWSGKRSQVKFFITLSHNSFGPDFICLFGFVIYIELFIGSYRVVRNMQYTCLRSR
jgi:hypothetical protein